MIVLYSRGLGVVQSDFVWYHCSTGWTLLISGSFTAWSVGAGFFVHYKNLTAREALETLQTFPITFLFFMPRMYTSATREDLKSFHFPKLSSCITTSEPMNKDAMFKWKEVTGIDIRDVYGQTEVVSSRHASASAFWQLKMHSTCVGSLSTKGR